VIGSLRGVLLDRDLSGEVLVEVGGVGYRVTVAPRTAVAMQLDAPVFLHVHHHIREDAQTLYGFLAREERVAFESLITAHGVGPALAMAILSVHSPAALRDAVAADDLDALCLVPGVGKKTAARLVIELKNKLDLPASAVTVVPGSASATSSAVADVREALAGLGYSTEEIREALRSLPAGTDSAALLREALGLLGARRA
jgi:Holliday junction DNA helicase RuvA